MNIFEHSIVHMLWNIYSTCIMCRHFPYLNNSWALKHFLITLPVFWRFITYFHTLVWNNVIRDRSTSRGRNLRCYPHPTILENFAVGTLPLVIQYYNTYKNGSSMFKEILLYIPLVYLIIYFIVLTTFL